MRACVRVHVDACTRVANVRPGDRPRGSACSFRASSVRRPAHGPAPKRHRSAKAKAGRPNSSAQSTAASETHEATHQLEDILWARLAVVVKLSCATQPQTPSDRQTVRPSADQQGNPKAARPQATGLPPPTTAPKLTGPDHARLARRLLLLLLPLLLLPLRRHHHPGPMAVIYDALFT